MAKHEQPIIAVPLRNGRRRSFSDPFKRDLVEQTLRADVSVWIASSSMTGQYACRRGHSALYQRVPRLQEELRIRHGSGVFGRWLTQLAKTDVLVLDDWGTGAIDNATRSDLLEIIDDRAPTKATIITSQLPIEHWHAWIGDATIADAILDRIMQRNHRLTLTGDSLRQEKPKPLKKEKTIDPS